jgi:hypothetical protein
MITDALLVGVSSASRNVSQGISSIHHPIAFLGLGGAQQNPNFESASVSPAADKAAVVGAIVMAWTVFDIDLNPEARGDFRRRTAEHTECASKLRLEA